MIFIRFYLQFHHVWHAFVCMISTIQVFTNIKIENMKKLMILSAAALAICLAMPQLAEATTVQNITTVSQTKAVKYQEIAPTALPEVINAAIAKDYAGSAIDKAFQGDDGSFKVILSKDAAKTTLLFSSKGELLK